MKKIEMELELKVLRDHCIRLNTRITTLEKALEGFAPVTVLLRLSGNKEVRPVTLFASIAGTPTPL